MSSYIKMRVNLTCTCTFTNLKMINVSLKRHSK